MHKNYFLNERNTVSVVEITVTEWSHIQHTHCAAAHICKFLQKAEAPASLRDFLLLLLF